MLTVGFVSIVTKLCDTNGHTFLDNGTVGIDFTG